MGEHKYDLKKLVSNFIFEGEFIQAEPYGFGHINDTFAASFKKHDGSMRRYIIQRINHNVFREPVKLMENIEGITGHLREKIIESGGNPERETLNIIPAIEGRSYYKDADGNYWRSYIFIEDAQTYQIARDPMHFYHSGKAIGKFQGMLSDYPVYTLHETISGFHDTGKRFGAFSEAVRADVRNRAREVAKEIEFVFERADDTGVLTDMLQNGELPLRVTHNDTKFNNVMIDNETGKGICLIDLDTVMPGLSLYDFGDSIRFGTNPAAEDERDLSKVWMQLDMYKSFTQGFLETAGSFLTDKEVELLPFGARMMTFECGIRFLTDYLNGDTYFKIHRERHNLDRARTQFKLVADMEKKMDEMLHFTTKHMKVLK